MSRHDKCLAIKHTKTVWFVYLATCTYPPTNPPTSLPTHLPTSPPTHPPAHQPIHQPTNPSTGLPTSLPTQPQAYQPTHQLAHPSAHPYDSDILPSTSCHLQSAWLGCHWQHSTEAHRMCLSPSPNIDSIQMLQDKHRHVCTLNTVLPPCLLPLHYCAIYCDITI